MKQCDIWKARKNWLVSLKHTHFRLMSRFCCCYLVHGLGRGLIFYVSVLCLRLKEFYYKCRNLQYFKHLVQVPSLPDVSFCLVFQSWTLVCSLDLLNTELSLERQGLAATEIPGGRGRGNCTTSHTVTTRMISALGWRVMRAGLMLQFRRWRAQTTTSEEKGEAKWEIEPALSAYQPNAVPPGQTGSRVSWTLRPVGVSLINPQASGLICCCTHRLTHWPSDWGDWLNLLTN